MNWDIMNDNEFGSRKLFILRYRRGDQIIQTFCNIGYPQKSGPPSLTCTNFKTLRKVLLNHQNAWRSNEWQGIWVHQTFKIEIQNGQPNNSDLLQNWFPVKIRSPLFNLYKFQDSQKSTPESCRMHWNLMMTMNLGLQNF